MLKITSTIIFISLFLLAPINISAVNISQEINNFHPGEDDFDFSISPNPAKDIITIKFPKHISGIIFIHDNLGNQVLDREINDTINETIPLHNFNSGIYFVSVKTSEKTVIKRLVKY